jgi:hypothetical protein
VALLSTAGRLSWSRMSRERRTRCGGVLRPCVLDRQVPAWSHAVVTGGRSCSGQRRLRNCRSRRSTARKRRGRVAEGTDNREGKMGKRRGGRGHLYPTQSVMEGGSRRRSGEKLRRASGVSGAVEWGKLASGCWGIEGEWIRVSLGFWGAKGRWRHGRLRGRGRGRGGRLRMDLTSGSHLSEKKRKGGPLQAGWVVRAGPFGFWPLFLLNSFLFNFLFSTKHFKQGRKLVETKFNFFCKIQVNQNSTARDIEPKK